MLEKAVQAEGEATITSWSKVLRGEEAGRYTRGVASATPLPLGKAITRDWDTLEDKATLALQYRLELAKGTPEGLYTRGEHTAAPTPLPKPGGHGVQAEKDPRVGLKVLAGQGTGGAPPVQ
jgi:hypothetical protein